MSLKSLYNPTLPGRPGLIAEEVEQVEQERRGEVAALRSPLVRIGLPLAALVVGAAAGYLVGLFLPDGPHPLLLAAILGLVFPVGAVCVVRVGSRALPRADAPPAEQEPRHGD